MPPKRKRRGSPPPKGLAPGEKLKRSKLPGNASSQWSWVGTEASATTDITPEHRLLVYGLSSRSQNPFCPNKYSGKQTSAHSLELPEDDVIIVSDEEVHPCDAKSCKSNPNCLNYLGQDVWESEEKVVKTFLKEFNLGHNPAEDDRQHGLPIGLRNLGATCYANAFLQVWYRNLSFRSGVYSCKNPESAEHSPIFQLQATFAALQEGVKKVFNPIKLMESLRLRTEEQQDAQEFSKLFISHLDSEFQKQDDADLKKLVTRQFQGTQVYATECQKCGFRSESKSQFLELELNLKNDCRLEEQLQTYLQPESLTDDNRYHCSQCESLQDATRRIELQQLPPVLHFSLLRFVFDMASLGRKKTKHNITFPLVLDMNKYLASPDMNGDNIYELRGILLHKGASAYHGHYEAQVFDSEAHEWFQFNDEQVTKMKPPGEKPKAKVATGKSKDGNLRSKASGPRKNKNTDKVDCNDAALETSSSRDAYMLVYAKKNSVQVPHPPVIPPSEALLHVQSDHDTHAKDKGLYAKKEKVVIEWLKNLRHEVMGIYQAWSVQSPEQDSVLATRSALNSWLSELPKKYSLLQPEGDADLPTMEAKDTNYSVEDIMCPHRLIDPLKTSSIKRINKSIYHDLMESKGWTLDPVFTTSDLCQECIALQFTEKLYEIEHPQLVTKFSKLAEDGLNHDDTSYWISKPWLKDWKLNRPKMHIGGGGDPAPDSPDFVYDVLCQHDGLQVNTSRRTELSHKTKSLLQTLYPGWNPPASAQEICAICEASEGIQRAGKKEERKRAEEEKSLLRVLYDDVHPTPSPEQVYALVNCDFVKAWKEWVDSPTDLIRPDKLDNGTLLCPHAFSSVDFATPFDQESVVALVEPQLWGSLASLYQAGPHITLSILEDEHVKTYITDPPPCMDCAQQRAFGWSSTSITVRTATAGKGKKVIKPHTYGSSTQNNRRLTRNRGFNAKISLDVEKSTTVKDIMVKIQGRWNIPTICQQLAFNGRLLENGSATMEELGMCANGLLELTRLDEVHNVDSDLDESANGPRDEGNAFAGTLLSSSQPEIESDKLSLDSDVREKSCSACTYMNTMDVVACEMCGTMFVEQ